MPISHFSDITGMLEFNTALGGDGNGIAMPDWDRNIFFTTDSNTGACATWDLTAVDTPPTRLHFHATNGGDFFNVGAFDSAGYWYLSFLNGFGFTIRKLAPDLQTKTDLAIASPSVAQPSNWLAALQIGAAPKDYLVSVGAAEADLINLTTFAYVGRVAIATETVAICNGRTGVETDQWLLAHFTSSGGSFNRPGQPFGLHKVHLQVDNVVTPMTVTRICSIQPSILGWTNFISAGDLIGDETDGNPIVFASTTTFAAYNGATSYGQFACVSNGGHDFESLVNANVGNATSDATKWRDLGVSHAAESAMFKVNGATGALIWKIVLVGGVLNGYREMSRIRYGKYRVLEPAAYASSNHHLHDVNTLTGADNVRDLWNVSPSGAKQHYDDKSGRWIAGVGYGYSAGTPGSPAPIGATTNVFNTWGELGPNPWTQPPAGLTNPVRVQAQVFG